MSTRGPWSAYLDDYVRFHKMQVTSGDVDPVYRVLQEWAPELGPRRAAVLSFLHVAYYDVGSAVRALANGAPSTITPPILGYPCATERRAHRSRDQLRKHLDGLQAIEDNVGLFHWAVGYRGYGPLFEALQTIYGNGRWAGYKTTELLSWSLAPFHPAAPLWEPNDMGHRHSSGPRKGLALLYHGQLPEGTYQPTVDFLDQLSVELVEELRERGVEATMATAETTLCDFHSLVMGRYYPGHDIHQMFNQWRYAMGEQPSLREAAALRRFDQMAQRAFPGEWGKPIDTMRRRHYQMRGILA